MITEIRGYLRSGTYKVVLWIIVFMLAFGSLPSIINRSKSGGPWVFRINKEEVSQADVMREIDKQKSYLASLRAQYGEYADMFFKNININQLAVTTVQQEELIHQVAQHMALRIDRDYIAEKLHDPRFMFGDLYGLVPHNALTDNGIDQAVLHRHLQARGLSMEEFEQKAKRVIAAQLVFDMVGAGAYTPLFELRSLYSARYLDKKFSYLQLNLDNYLRAETQKEVTKKDLSEFYEQHKASYEVPEKRSGIVWAIDPRSFDVQATDDKVEAYYAKHKASSAYEDKPSRVQVRTILFAFDENEDSALRNTVQQKAQEFRTKLIEKPATFESEARKVSADSDTKEKGGLVPFFAKGEKSPQFERAAFLLKTPGDISEVVETPRGFEILQLVEKQLRTVKPLASVKDDIKRIIVNREFGGLFEMEMKKLLAQQAQDTLALNNFVTHKKATKQIKNHVVAGPSQELKFLFDIKKIDGITYYKEDGKGFIVQLTDVAKQYAPPLAQVEAAVKADYYKDKAKQALKADLVRAQQLSSDASMATLQKQFSGSTIGASDWLKMSDAEQLKRFFPQGTSLDFLVHMEKAGSTAIKITNNGGILVKVDALQEIDEADFAAKQNSLRAESERKEERLAIEGFVASLYRNATIESNDNMAIY